MYTLSSLYVFNVHLLDIVVAPLGFGEHELSPTLELIGD